MIYNGLCKFNDVVLLKIIFQNLCQSTDFVEDLFLLTSTKFIVQHAFTVFYDIDTNKSIRTTTWETYIIRTFLPLFDFATYYSLIKVSKKFQMFIKIHFKWWLHIFVFTGNGKIAASLDSDSGLFIRLNRALSLPVKYYPVVSTKIINAKAKGCLSIPLYNLSFCLSISFSVPFTWYMHVHCLYMI